MAYPFGGHPTLARFIKAAEEAGCVVTLDYRETTAGGAYEALQIRNPNGGGRLIIPDPIPDEVLSPSLVTNYQRRLGIKTTFAATPEQSPSDASTVREGE